MTAWQLSDISSLIAFRRDIHAHPELGYREHRTSAKIAERLEKAGLKVLKNIGATGVLGILNTSDSQQVPALLYRADIDALPIEEQTGVSYQSQYKGIMHACGHDIHLTIALGVAELLAKYKSHLPAGRWIFLFQPNEEGAPGQKTGAQAVWDQGVLQKLHIGGAMAIHVMPDLPFQTFGWKEAGLWASSDRFEVLFKGRQTHGAYPHLGQDLILAGTQWVGWLYQHLSRKMDAHHLYVMSVTQIQGGHTFNVLPDRIQISGIFRTFEPKVRTLLKTHIRDLTRSYAQALDLEVEVAFFKGADPVINDPAMLRWVLKTLRQHLDGHALQPIQAQWGAEDFSVFSRHFPSVYLMLGIQKGQNPYPLHSPKLVIDDHIIPWAVEKLSAVLKNWPHWIGIKSA